MSSSSSFNGYCEVYPPAYSFEYVNASTYLDVGKEAFVSCDPSKSLVGIRINKEWWSKRKDNKNQKFNINLGVDKVITGIYYENSHNYGKDSGKGWKDVILYGSNTYDAFNNFNYNTLSNLTQLWSGQFEMHSFGDSTDPKYVYFSNSSSYRYYIFRVASTWEGIAGEYMCIRRVTLLEDC